MGGDIAANGLLPASGTVILGFHDTILSFGAALRTRPRLFLGLRLFRLIEGDDLVVVPERQRRAG
jgi:hypothetical protein